MSRLVFAKEFYKGGGGYVPPPPDHSLELEQMRQAEQRRRDEENRRLADEKHAADVASSTQRVSGAYNAARDYGASQLRAKGLDPTTDPYGVLSAYTSALDRARSGAPEIVTDAGALFAPSMWTDAYGAARTGNQSKLRKEFQGFAGDGFDTQLIPDTMDDAILDSILNEQKGEAQSAIDRAYARGQINDAGKTKAASLMGQQQRAGRARAEDMGLGVLGGYRKQLTDEAKRFGGRIDAWDLGDDLNIGAENENIQGIANRSKSRMEGDILNAIGGTNFFDTDTILGKAGNASGLTNNVGANPSLNLGATSPLLAAFTDDTNKQGSQVGSAGAF